MGKPGLWGIEKLYFLGRPGRCSSLHSGSCPTTVQIDSEQQSGLGHQKNVALKNLSPIWDEVLLSHYWLLGASETLSLSQNLRPKVLVPRFSTPFCWWRRSQPCQPCGPLHVLWSRSSRQEIERPQALRRNALNFYISTIRSESFLNRAFQISKKFAQKRNTILFCLRFWTPPCWAFASHVMRSRATSHDFIS